MGVVRALRSDRERALSVLPEGLQHYLDVRIAAASWYPESDFLGLMEAFFRMFRNQQSWESVGALAAREAFATVYRSMVIEGDVAGSAHLMQVNWRNYHDTGELTAEHRPGLLRVKVEGYCLVSPGMCRLNQGYFQTFLEKAGAIVTAQRKVYCTARADAYCLWEFDWQMRPGLAPP